MSDGFRSVHYSLRYWTYYVSSNAASSALNEIRPTLYDPKRPPAASKAAVRGIGLDLGELSVDLIAVPRK